MDAVTWCEACQRRHHRLMVCAPRVVHKPADGSPQDQLVVHLAPDGSPHGSPRAAAPVVHTSRHGVYADADKRKAYKREWMRARRAKS